MDDSEKIGELMKSKATGEKRSLLIATAIFQGTCKRGEVLGHGYNKEFKVSKVQYITIDLD